jgi:hypothetical protein
MASYNVESWTSYNIKEKQGSFMIPHGIKWKYEGPSHVTDT